MLRLFTYLFVCSWVGNFEKTLEIYFYYAIICVTILLFSFQKPI